MWGATVLPPLHSCRLLYFNPRAPCGARPAHELHKLPALQFQSTRPVWGATFEDDTAEAVYFVFQSTRPVWGATSFSRARLDVQLISIHAPRVGRDPGRPSNTARISRFQSTRPVWGATDFRTVTLTIDAFQSTRPVWGATSCASSSPGRTAHFNPRAPCGARLQPLKKFSIASSISIHAPRVGRDIQQAKIPHCYGRFQSTRPVWGATRIGTLQDACKRFQSTRPVWGATCYSRAGCCVGCISIHAPRVGRDYVVTSAWQPSLISIHAPRVGRDRKEG